jgi:hypothetical protein
MAWTVAGPVIGLLGVVATVWVTLRVANTKRRLMYSMPVVTPLLNATPDMPTGIEVRRDGHILNSPRIANIKLVSRGTRDIRRSDFDGDQPVRLEIGTPIVECLKVSTIPPDRGHPACIIDGSALLIGPCLIGSRQSTTFSLLVDGPEPTLSDPEQILTDVRIMHGDPDVRARGWKARVREVLTWLLIALVIWLLIEELPFL